MDVEKCRKNREHAMIPLTSFQRNRFGTAAFLVCGGSGIMLGNTFKSGTFTSFKNVL